MARKLVLELILDSAAYTRQIEKAQAQTAGFAKGVERAGAATTTATVGFRNLGGSIARSVAVVGGGFLAFEGVSSLLEKSVEVARDAAVTQRQLAAQMKASGESFAGSRERIEQAGLSLAKFGFTSEDSEKALVVLDRATGNITKSIQLQGISADLARAKNIDLASAANVVAKVFGGQETALRRAVPGLDKTAHGYDLIQEAAAKLAGQARAATTPQEKFAAVLFDTEKIIGEGLLPILNQYLTSISKWLEKANRTGEVQRDVAQAVSVLKDAISVAKTVVDGVVGAFKGLNAITGSTRESMKLLLSVFVAFKGLKLAASLAETATSIGLIGTNAETSTGKVTGLKGALAGLPKVVGVTIIVESILHKKEIDDFLKRHHAGILSKSFNDDITNALDKVGLGSLNQGLIRDIADRFGDTGKKAGESSGNLFGAGFIDQLQKQLGKYGAKVPATLRGITDETVPGGMGLPTGVAALSPFSRSQLALSAAGLTPGTADNLKALTTQRVLLQAKIAAETKRLENAVGQKQAQKFADALQKLQDQQSSVISQIDSINQAAQKAQPKGITAGQRNTWFDTMISRALDRVQDIPTMKGQIARLKEIGGLVTQAVAATKDVTRRQTLGDTLAGIRRTITGDTAQAAQTVQQQRLDAAQLVVDRAGLTKSLSDDLAALRNQLAVMRAQGATQSEIVAKEKEIQAKEDEIAQAKKDHLAAVRQQKTDAAALAVQRAGLTASLTDDLAALKHQLAVLRETGATESQILDQRKAIQDKNQQIADKARQGKLDAAQLAVARAGLTNSLTDDLRALTNQLAVMRKTHASQLDIVGQQKAILDKKTEMADATAAAAAQSKKALDSATQDATTTRQLFQRINSTAFVHQFGAGLTREQKRRLEIGLAVMGPGGTVPAGQSGQFTAGLTIHGGVHMHGVQDVPGMENQLAKRAKARPYVRRGARG